MYIISHERNTWPLADDAVTSLTVDGLEGGLHASAAERIAAQPPTRFTARSGEPASWFLIVFV
jgi:hypothetical protein